MIEAEGLGRRFGNVVAVDDVSLQVPDGTILALLGPNGAGKTTIVRMLTGVLAMTTGRATVAGYDVGRDPSAVRARIGLVTDVPGLHEQMSVAAYLDFFGSVYGMPSPVRARRVDELLTFFDLQAHRKERMVGFSKGMKQKVALARALLHEPAALFLDEPSSGLDPLSARAVRELILAMKHANRSIILCTHDLDEADRMADQIIILRQGHVVACGEPSRLRTLGSPETIVRIVLAEPLPGAQEALEGLSEPITLIDLATDAASPTTPVLEYRTRQPLKVNPRVIERLVAAGGQVVSVTSTARSLEDVYASVMAGGFEEKSE